MDICQKNVGELNKSDGELDRKLDGFFKPAEKGCDFQPADNGFFRYRKGGFNNDFAVKIGNNFSHGVTVDDHLPVDTKKLFVIENRLDFVQSFKDMVFLII
jgi:hypothetical protein